MGASLVATNLAHGNIHGDEADCEAWGICRSKFG